MARAQNLKKDQSTSGVDAGEPFPEFKDLLAYQAQFLARLMQADFNMRIADAGIAPAQAYVLGELAIEQPLSQVELARRLDIGRATIGKTLLRMEKAGVIERRRLTSDRRVIMIRLTEYGQALRQPLLHATQSQKEMLTELLGAKECEVLARAMKRATRVLSQRLDVDVEI